MPIFDTSDIQATGLTVYGKTIFTGTGNNFLSISGITGQTLSINDYSGATGTTIFISAGTGVVIGGASFDPVAPEALVISAFSPTSYNIISAHAKVNNYAQMNVQNLGQNIASSSDLVATNDLGTETSYYVDLGINSSTYVNNPGLVGFANDSYLYAVNNDLWIGNLGGVGSDVRFFTNTGGTVDMILSGGTGNLGLGISTNNPTNKLHVSALTNPLRVVGLQSASDTLVVTTDATGVFHTYPLTSIGGALSAITGFSVVNNTINATISGGTLTSSTINAVTGGTYSTASGTISLSGTGIVSANTITGFPFGPSGNTFPTAFTYTSTANTFTLTNNTGGTLSALFNTVSGLTVNGNFTVTGNSVFKAITGTSAIFSGSGGNIVQISGAGTTTVPVLNVVGSAGTLFSVYDSFSGTVFTVNDISGLPLFQVNSNSTILMGSFQAPSLNSTAKASGGTGNTVIYSAATSAYTGGFFDYVISGATGMRNGVVSSVWSGTSAFYTDYSNNSFGNVTGLGVKVGISGTSAVLSFTATTGAWVARAIARLI